MASKTKNASIIYIVILAVALRGVSGQYHHYNEFEGLHPPEEAPMWCFQCSSTLDKDCAYIQPNDTSSYHYKPCLDTEKYNGTKPFCRKIVQRIMVRDNMEVVIRKCGWVKHPRLECYKSRNEDHEETICQCFDPGCNGSPSLPRLGALALTVVGLHAYFWYAGH